MIFFQGQSNLPPKGFDINFYGVNALMNLGKMNLHLTLTPLERIFRNNVFIFNFIKM